MWNRVVYVGLVCMVIAISSCGGSSPSQESASNQYEQLTPVPPAPAPTSAASAPAAEPAATPPAPVDPPVQPNLTDSPEIPVHDANVALNGAFEVRDEFERPNGWIVSPTTIMVEETGTAPQGKRYLELEGAPANYGIIATNLSINEADLAKPLRVEAWGKAGADDTMFMIVAYTEKGKDKEAGKKYFPKSGDEWTKVEFSVTLPKAADAGSAQVKVLLRDKAGKGYALDNVRVTTDLSANASLDSTDDTGRPSGWFLSPPESLSDKKVTPYDGTGCVALKGVQGNWGVLGRDITVQKSDLGRVLTASAWGQASKANDLSLTIRGSVDGNETVLGSTPWMESPDWSQAVVQVVLPTTLDPKTLQLRVILRDGAEGEYAVDHTQVSLN